MSEGKQPPVVGRGRRRDDSRKNKVGLPEIYAVCKKSTGQTEMDLYCTMKAMMNAKRIKVTREDSQHFLNCRVVRKNHVGAAQAREGSGLELTRREFQRTFLWPHQREKDLEGGNETEEEKEKEMMPARLFIQWGVAPVVGLLLAV